MLSEGMGNFLIGYLAQYTLSIGRRAYKEGKFIIGKEAAVTHFVQESGYMVFYVWHRDLAFACAWT